MALRSRPTFTDPSFDWELGVWKIIHIIGNRLVCLFIWKITKQIVTQNENNPKISYSKFETESHEPRRRTGAQQTRPHQAQTKPPSVTELTSIRVTTICLVNSSGFLSSALLFSFRIFFSFTSRSLKIKHWGEERGQFTFRGSHHTRMIKPVRWVSFRPTHDFEKFIRVSCAPHRFWQCFYPLDMTVALLTHNVGFDRFILHG